jgi:methylated-DNA-[protein]-cysteine S-methyltransferase
MIPPYQQHLATSLGNLLLVANAEGEALQQIVYLGENPPSIPNALQALGIPAQGAAQSVGFGVQSPQRTKCKNYTPSTRSCAILKEAAQQIQHYLAGQLHQFTLPLAIEGTAFQQRIWQELQQIPYGETISYRILAERAGNPKAVRAAGSACGSNPLPLIIPCHRVLQSGGALGGFAWGVEVKLRLLRIEANQLQP